ncbi:hypothetical protein [Bacillus sp. NPDC094106]|uniref:hypothetical protein n=1 Tax=Bacillus sp. NPDC094106 TaxID=3363949 RepID=UPI00380DFA4E
MDIKVIVNEVPLTVIADFDKLKEQVTSKKVEVKEEGPFMKLYSVDEYATEEESMNDIDEMLSFLESIMNSHDVLSDYVTNVRKKKNGKFWLNSGLTLSKLSCVTEYFTDYTNAWSTPQLRLEVIDEDTCELVFRNRTET